jgi:protein SSD1
MKSFDAIGDPTARRLLELLSFKATQRAKYFCAGMLDIAKYSHYALNTPLYTHFTSPIRRYADILVHRQLEAVLQGGGEGVNRTTYYRLIRTYTAETKFTMDRDAVAKVAQQCNMYVVSCCVLFCIDQPRPVNATPLSLRRSSQRISSFAFLFRT